MGVFFDGPNKLIICSTGTIEVDVKQDIYSNWKEWVLESDNAKYLEAMSVVGGDAITAELSLGATFFLENGWRIRPQEASHTLNINGNIYVREGGVPYIQTLSNYNVMVINKVSSLVDSTISQLPEIEYSSFNNQVTIDAISGTAGTSYPQGTLQSPVNNLTDALSIAISRGIKTLYFIGNFVFGPTTYLIDYSLVGSGSQASTFTFQTGAIVAYCKASKAKVTGLAVGMERFDDCLISNYGSSGLVASSRNVIVRTCLFEGTTSIPSNYTGTLYCLDSWSGSTQDNIPIIDVNGANCNVIARNWSGGIQYNNFTHSTSHIDTDLSSGKVVIDSSNTRGHFRIAGIGTVIDNSDEEVEVDLTGAILPDASYAGAVYIDTSTGISGIEYPAGISTHPVATIEDAIIIANTYNLREFKFRGMLIITTSFSNWTFTGIGSVLSDIVVGTGTAITTCRFERCSITGSAIASTLQMVECVLSDAYGFDGLLFNCGIQGTLGLGAEGSSLLGKSNVAMGSAALSSPTIIDMIGINRYMNMELTSGDIKVVNAGSGSIIQLTVGNGGICELDSSCTEGITQIAGLGFVVNNSTMTVTNDCIGDTIDKIDSTTSDNQALILAK